MSRNHWRGASIFHFTAKSRGGGATAMATSRVVVLRIRIRNCNGKTLFLHPCISGFWTFSCCNQRRSKASPIPHLDVPQTDTLSISIPPVSFSPLIIHVLIVSFPPASMASPSLLRRTTRPELYVCARCAFRAAQPSTRGPKRCISTSFLNKVAAAEVQWQERAVEVQAGKRKSLLTVLEERGLIQAITG